MANKSFKLTALTPEGYEAEIEVTLAEGESLTTTMKKAASDLQKAGFKPRPQRSFGGNGWAGKRQPEQLPEKCPQCQGAIKQENWTSREGKTFTIHKCASDQTHFKKFIPVQKAG
jgi:hypothetical protein